MLTYKKRNIKSRTWRKFQIISTCSLFALVTSCSPQKKLARLVKKHPELVRQDTIKIVDTIYVQQVNIDTVTKIIEHDSVIVINNDKVLLRYFYDTLRQEIYHDVTCKEDTVIYEKEIVHDVIEMKPNYTTFWWVLILSILVAFLIWKNRK